MHQLETAALCFETAFLNGEIRVSFSGITHFAASCFFWSWKAPAKFAFMQMSSFNVPYLNADLEERKKFDIFNVFFNPL